MFCQIKARSALIIYKDSVLGRWSSRSWASDCLQQGGLTGGRKWASQYPTYLSWYKLSHTPPRSHNSRWGGLRWGSSAFNFLPVVSRTQQGTELQLPPTLTGKMVSCWVSLYSPPTSWLSVGLSEKLNFYAPMPQWDSAMWSLNFILIDGSDPWVSWVYIVIWKNTPTIIFTLQINKVTAC